MEAPNPNEFIDYLDEESPPDEGEERNSKDFHCCSTQSLIRPLLLIQITPQTLESSQQRLRKSNCCTQSGVIRQQQFYGGFRGRFIRARDGNRTEIEEKKAITSAPKRRKKRPDSDLGRVFRIHTVQTGYTECRSHRRAKLIVLPPHLCVSQRRESPPSGHLLPQHYLRDLFPFKVKESQIPLQAPSSS